MITQNRHSVNVLRKELLDKLRENVEIHKKDYAEACIGYRIKLVADLKKALVLAETVHDTKLHNLRAVAYDHPRSYENEYNEIIDMMEASVDDVIQLDSTSFKQYFKNEWSWSNHFNTANSLYKSVAAGAVVA